MARWAKGSHRNDKTEPVKVTPIVSDTIVAPTVTPTAKVYYTDSGSYWRSLTREEKDVYRGLYTNPVVRANIPDVVELAWSEYVKRPK